ncbi:MAG: hypothetical protein GXY07_15665 [Candidatus Hydrogenedentes bacterium]|nr:hypothetical protein [Candidatus Hydrogenedentota bacterium]
MKRKGGFLCTVNPMLHSWLEYFKHSHNRIQEEIDGWLRRRLRFIHCKRANRNGHGRGLDHHRHPTTFLPGTGCIA